MPAIKSVASLRAAKATKPVYYNIHLNGHTERKRGSRITLHSRAFACEYGAFYRKGKTMTRDKKRVPRRSNIDNDNDDEDEDDGTVFPQLPQPQCRRHKFRCLRIIWPSTYGTASSPSCRTKEGKGTRLLSVRAGYLYTSSEKKDGNNGDNGLTYGWRGYEVVVL